MNTIPKQVFLLHCNLTRVFKMNLGCSMTMTTTTRPQRSQASAGTSSDSNLKTDDLVLSFLEGNRIAVFAMNRPSVRNAMSKNLISLLHSFTLNVAQNPSVRVVIVRSLVPGIFCAGADLHERYAMTNTEVWHHTVNQRRVLTELENLPMPVIAAMDGLAYGGGLEIALACDLRIAASSIKMGLVETKLGIIPGAGGTQRLPRLIGRPLANELIYTGRVIDGNEAGRIRLVNHVVGQIETGDAAFKSAVELATQEILPNGPLAVRMAKFATSRGCAMGIDNGLKIEELCFAQLIPTKDRLEAEGMEPFTDKRPPNLEENIKYLQMFMGDELETGVNK